jgi:Skp family chaperone for outer membrane proteins
MRAFLPLLLVFSALLTPALVAAEAAKPAAPKICVLRLEDVLKANKEYLDGMASWKKDQETIGATLKAIDEKLQDLDGKLQVLKSDHPSFASFQEELESLKLKKKLTIDRARNDLEKRQVTLVKKVFAQVRTQLGTFCQERGIMLVHLAPDGELNSNGFSDLQLELGIKSVLWYDASMDITEAFIPFMNGAPGAVAPAAPVDAPKP